MTPAHQQVLVELGTRTRFVFVVSVGWAVAKQGARVRARRIRRSCCMWNRKGNVGEGKYGRAGGRPAGAPSGTPIIIIKTQKKKSGGRKKKRRVQRGLLHDGEALNGRHTQPARGVRREA